MPLVAGSVAELPMPWRQAIFDMMDAEVAEPPGSTPAPTAEDNRFVDMDSETYRRATEA